MQDWATGVGLIKRVLCVLLGVDVFIVKASSIDLMMVQDETSQQLCAGVRVNLYSCGLVCADRLTFIVSRGNAGDPRVVLY